MGVGASKGEGVVVEVVCTKLPAAVAAAWDLGLLGLPCFGTRYTTPCWLHGTAARCRCLVASCDAVVVATAVVTREALRDLRDGEVPLNWRLAHRTFYFLNTEVTKAPSLIGILTLR